MAAVRAVHHPSRPSNPQPRSKKFHVTTRATGRFTFVLLSRITGEVGAVKKLNSLGDSSKLTSAPSFCRTMGWWLKRLGEEHGVMLVWPAIVGSAPMMLARTRTRVFR